MLSIKKKAIIVSLAAVIFFIAPVSATAAQASFLNQLQGLLSSLISNKAPVAPSATPAPSASSGGSSATIGIPFGGPIIFGPIKCTTPPGATYVIVGPPVSKPLLCQKGVCKTYDAQPPYRIGQHLLGVALPTPIPCIVGITPIPQPPGFPIGNTPGVGAGGALSSDGSPLSAPQSACVQNSYKTNNTFTKSVSENAVREQLNALGIGVNNNACDFGQRFQTHRRIFGQGCTDLSGLQCGTTNYLQDLQQVCGAGSLVVTGGSELGHITHDTGNAVDLRVQGTGLQSCLDTKTDRFTNLGGGKYRDKKTGSIFTFEAGELHYHVCVPGSGC